MFTTPSEPEQPLHQIGREKEQHLMQRKSRSDLNSAQILSNLSAVRENTNNSQTVASSPKFETIPENSPPVIASLEEFKDPDQKTANLYQWFDEYNSHPEKENFGSPYILQHSSSNSSAYSPENAHLLARGARAGGSSGEYRSVIDDLTIENKRLRKELRRFKRQTNRQLENDKLFEIRIHALPPAKRRELENALRSFTSSLNSSNGDQGSTLDTPQNTTWSQKIPPSPAKISSSANTQDSRLQNSSSTLMRNSTRPTSVNQDMFIDEQRKSNEANLRSNHSRSQSPVENLSEITSGCGLKNLSKNQKKKLVVQRLEQLFTGGKGIIMGKAGNALNQQEISTSALETQPKYTLAGAREANMGPIKNETASQPFETTSDSRLRSPSDITEDSNLNSADFDQRPTQPLDLDPDRDQVPSDNLDYIRHLGISTPELANHETANNSNEKGRWVYLNLLINMAQLHMINVTADFVRSAIKDCSRNFQLSKDGQMLLWKGGNEMTSLENDNASINSSENESCNNLAQYHYGVQGTEKTPNHQLDPDTTMVPNDSLSDFQYKPLVYRRAASENSSQRTDSLLSRSTPNQSISSLNPSYNSQRGSERVISSERKQYEDGSMIFYSGVNFYTDLSGDRNAGMLLLSNHSSYAESNISGSSHEFPAVKTGQNMAYPKPTHQRFDEIPVSPIQKYHNMESGMIPEYLERSSCDGFCLSEFPTESKQMPKPLQQFETSGIGGSQPADHFGIRVLTCRSTALDSTSKLCSSGTPHIRPNFMSPILKKFPNGLPRLNYGDSNDGSAQVMEKKSSHSSLSSQLASRRNLPVTTKIITSEMFTIPSSGSLPYSLNNSVF